MSEPHVLYRVVGHIAVITLNRPDQRHRITRRQPKPSLKRGSGHLLENEGIDVSNTSCGIISPLLRK